MLERRYAERELHKSDDNEKDYVWMDEVVLAVLLEGDVKW